MPEPISLIVNGRALCVAQGTTVAAAVILAGFDHTRRSATGAPRAPLCGMGICFECRVVINGQPHQRSCLIPCAPLMDIRTDAV